MRRKTISWLDRIILCFRKINRLERNFWNHEELFPHTSFLDVYALAWIGQDAVVDSSHSHFFLSEGHFPHHTTCLPLHSHLLRLRCASHQEARTDKRTDFSHVAHPPLQSLWWFWLRPRSREIPLDVLEKRNPQQLTSLLKSCSCGFLHKGFSTRILTN